MVTPLVTFLPIQILFVTNSVHPDVVTMQINFSRIRLLESTVGITSVELTNQQLKSTIGAYCLLEYSTAQVSIVAIYYWNQLM